MYLINQTHLYNPKVEKLECVRLQRFIDDCTIKTCSMPNMSIKNRTLLCVFKLV